LWVIDVDVTVERDIPREKVEAARGEIAKLQRYTDLPLNGGHVTVRHGKDHAKHPFVADVGVRVKGRLLAAHTTGRTPEEALDSALDRLTRQLQRYTKREVALRDEPRVLAHALDGLDLVHVDPVHRPETQLKPPEQREIIHRGPYVSVPLSTVEAVRDLLDLDVHFYLFTHVRTDEDVVVYRRDDHRIGLIHPRESSLADEDDIVVPEPNRYSRPLTVEQARTEEDHLNHRFLYFIDAGDGRGKVLYLRHDGDYGLVVPH
jgi:ribosome-associated translation inhibitor RaiA